ncbi:preprotein translocase subunit YajC [Viridibacterium curvum]|uniref:Sec translocon accessory complex subunit YajC n=1 Tax=Viridibacterium curvum TaxID=1101404 RepID=A0ABP9QF01_9RHOO
MLISTAHAQTAGAAADPTGGFSGILMMGLMLVVMYFLMIRPQMKRAKEHKALLDALAKGDEVMTNGGVAGTVTEVRDAFVKVEISSGVEILVQKSAVGAVLPKGTLKSA